MQSSGTRNNIWSGVMNFPGNKYEYKKSLCQLRQWLVGQVYPRIPLKPQGQELAQIAKTLSHLAGNEPTTYESGIVQTSATGSANLLTRQVERAMTQVLGRGPGRGPDGFMSALTGAFPTDAKGQVVFTPTRSLVSLYGSNGNGSTGQISVEQANLYRMGSLLATDGLRVLEGLKPFDPKADIDAVEALRGLIRSGISSLVEEFGRLDEPRNERVEHYLRSLLLHLLNFGKAVFAPNAQDIEEEEVQRYLISGLRDIELAQDCIKAFIKKNVHPVTVDDEAQLAGYELLLNYIVGLVWAWLRFRSTEIAETASDNYSARLSRASVLLPIIADSNASLMAAMDSVGFTQNERRSSSAKFSSLKPDPGPVLELIQPPTSDRENIPYSLADITVNDLNDWIDRFASVESPSILASSGRYGLETVVDQADTLFWVIGLALYTLSEKEDQPLTKLTSPAAESGEAENVVDMQQIVTPETGSGQSSLLQEIFTYERVKQSLRELLFYLKDLADLACPPPTDSAA